MRITIPPIEDLDAWVTTVTGLGFKLKVLVRDVRDSRVTFDLVLCYPTYSRIVARDLAEPAWRFESFCNVRNVEVVDLQRTQS